jgi:hypothetical protein
MILCSFGNKLIRNALMKGISPLIVNKLLINNTNKSSLIVMNRCINTTEKKKSEGFVIFYNISVNIDSNLTIN